MRELVGASSYCVALWAPVLLGDSECVRPEILVWQIRTFYELNEVMPFSSFVSLYYLCEQTVNLAMYSQRTLSRTRCVIYIFFISTQPTFNCFQRFWFSITFNSQFKRKKGCSFLFFNLISAVCVCEILLGSK